MEETIKNKFKQIKKLIGKTPLVKITYKFGGKTCFCYAKLEYYNLSGSVKDRPAYEMLYNAYLKGDLKQGQTICEATSGNMGLSVCALANILGNPVTICMPKFLSEERKLLLRMYGAKLVLTNNFEDAFKQRDELGTLGAFLPNQFSNYNNTKAHFNTAKEILKKVKPTAFVSGVGTGGTLMGVGKFLKEKVNSKIIAIDPLEADLLKSGKAKGKHKIQGLSDEIIPALYHAETVDKIISIKSDDAIAMSQKLCKELGLAVGISSGANFLGCVLSSLNGAACVFADDNKKYLSTDLATEQTSELVNKIKLINIETL